MLNLLKYELLINKKIILKELLFYIALIIVYVLIYEFFLKETLELSLDIIVIIPITSQSFGKLIVFRNEKTSSLYAKLPHTISELYIIRFVRVYIVSIMWILMVFPFRIFSLDLIQLSTMIVVIWISYGLLIFTDMKVYTERFGVIKRIICIGSPLIALTGINLIAILYLKKVHGQLTYDLLGSISLILIFAISLTLSYQIFKLRKNYKK